ncbi:MAG TPA: YkgJ family cysteine cluster protein [Candidatus Fusicatenibacter intestinigallinarum]|uniref:YkgJ family cysteine cluster protein n=1 Tax=Candidatus Fusicatenibacter intestinigallinarum TaxID=2838598 RepID=A0A9D2NBK9_9FIRM|nr:YkgJ family cysteine cluster protein [Candidatus Fusicatenibacter intestinigallinarum]
MERAIDWKEVSDGRLYGPNDMVKADCGDCAGCSACCRGMGSSILLDPLDIFRMTGFLNCSFEKLMERHVELNVVDGMILPNLKMVGAEEACSFLTEEGKCSIHPARPGICRIFPLGRLYEDGGFQYFLQVHECRKKNRSKIRVRKWIDTPDVRTNGQYICDWHYFLKDAERVLEQRDDEARKNWNLYLLQLFFVKPYRTQEEFYPQFYQRYFEAREVLASLG